MSIVAIKEHAIKVEKVNTNNSWGFNGKVGKRYYFKNGMVYFSGQVCFRHHTERYVQYLIPTPDKDKYPYDFTPITKEQFINALTKEIQK